MRFDKFMNIIFYILTTICVFFTLGNISSYFSNSSSDNSFSLPSFIILSIYFISYFYHIEYNKYILNTYYIDKDLREPDEYMIETFLNSYGYPDYKANSENINISDYSEEEIQKALKIYEKLKDKNIII